MENKTFDNTFKFLNLLNEFNFDNNKFFENLLKTHDLKITDYYIENVLNNLYEKSSLKLESFLFVLSFNEVFSIIEKHLNILDELSYLNDDLIKINFSSMIDDFKFFKSSNKIDSYEKFFKVFNDLDIDFQLCFDGYDELTLKRYINNVLVPLFHHNNLNENIIMNILCYEISTILIQHLDDLEELKSFDDRYLKINYQKFIDEFKKIIFN